MAQLLDQIEWGQPLLSPVSDPTWEGERRGRQAGRAQPLPKLGTPCYERLNIGGARMPDRTNPFGDETKTEPKPVIASAAAPAIPPDAFVQDGEIGDEIGRLNGTTADEEAARLQLDTQQASLGRSLVALARSVYESREALARIKDDVSAQLASMKGKTAPAPELDVKIGTLLELSKEIARVEEGLKRLRTFSILGFVVVALPWIMLLWLFVRH